MRDQYTRWMGPTTRRLWQKQDAHKGDRKRLFTAVKEALGDATVLYPGSYVDVAASFAFTTVTYVDVDRRAAQFFQDAEGVPEILAEGGGSPSATIEFIHADYTSDLDLSAQSFDMLVSLYASFVSEACTRYLRIGGSLLVAPSHGDAAMAAIDPRYELYGVVNSRSGEYRVRTDDLHSYLNPKKPVTVTPAYLHKHQRGIPYTKSPFAYLFTRTH